MKEIKQPLGFTKLSEGTNGHGKGLDEMPLREMETQLTREFRDLKAGRTENILLIEAITNNWSADQLRQVARRRGRNWRFLTSLTDQMLRVEADALLALSATAAGVDLAYFGMLKVGAGLDRVDKIVEDYEGQGKLDDRRYQLTETAKDFMQELYDDQFGRYLRRMGRLVDGQDY